ncbi:MAG TPA: hypothetical protein VLE49_12695, partial [Anaerolineales bacterium]|nr:hypothetical protein [Anaerolineales bacterium]
HPDHIPSDLLCPANICPKFRYRRWNEVKALESMRSQFKNPFQIRYSKRLTAERNPLQLPST